MSHDDDLTPEEEQVRRLLADARHTEPVPADVADRLDEVLISLQEPHADPVRTYPSAADLAAAHRRRRVRNWVLAAAAVVVVGVGINQVDLSGYSSSDSADSGAGGGVAAESAPNATTDQDDAFRKAVRRLSSEQFGEQVQELRAQKSDWYQSYSSAAPDEQDGTAELERDTGATAYSPLCDVVQVGPGRVVPVRYDGARGWLVFRSPEGDTQVVDLFLCGHDEPTRSITLPVR